jgi:hypothetical protein
MNQTQRDYKQTPQLPGLSGRYNNTKCIEKKARHGVPHCIVGGPGEMQYTEEPSGSPQQVQELACNQNTTNDCRPLKHMAVSPVINTHKLTVVAAPTAPPWVPAPAMYTWGEVLETCAGCALPGRPRDVTGATTVDQAKLGSPGPV